MSEARADRPDKKKSRKDGEKHKTKGGDSTTAGEDESEDEGILTKIKHAFSEDDISTKTEELTEQDLKKKKLRQIGDFIRLIIFFILWLYCLVAIAVKKEPVIRKTLLVIPPNNEVSQTFPRNIKTNAILVSLKSRFIFIEEEDVTKGYLFVDLKRKNTKIPVADTWALKLRPMNQLWNPLSETMWKHIEFPKQSLDNLEIIFKSTDDNELLLEVNLMLITAPRDVSVIAAAVILFILYALIVSNIVNKTFAAVMMCTVAIATLSFMGMRPTLDEIMMWVDVETLLLLFAMMILVSLLAETGLFDYFSVVAFKLSRGRKWPLVFYLSVAAALCASLLDSVTMTMLLCPVSIRLCEIMNMRVTPVLMTIIMCANMGGFMTPFGDPPNIIIISTAYVQDYNVRITDVLIHLMPCLLLTLILALIQIYLQIRDLNADPKEIEKDNQYKMIRNWKTAASTINPYSEEQRELKEGLMKQAHEKLKASGGPAVEEFRMTIARLEEKYKIQDMILLIKVGIAIIFAVICFFMQSVDIFSSLKICWSALLAMLLAIILSSRYNIQYLLTRVDWNTLLFFTTLFITTEAVASMGLIDWIGLKVSNIIMAVNEEHRIKVTIFILLWTAALLSTLIDNIPVTQMMLKLVVSLHKSSIMKLPLAPMLWAISLGACLGGNATCIGASANVIGTGLSESYGYKIKFLDWVKVGLPLMLTSTTLASLYLYLTHILPKWY